MVKSFKMFIEEKENIKKLKGIFLRRLGVRANILDDGQDFKLNAFDKNKLKEIVTEIGLDDDTASNLVNWIEMSYDTSSLSALLSMLKDSDLDFGDVSDEGLPTQPAALPPGSPKPQSSQPQNFNM